MDMAESDGVIAAAAERLVAGFLAEDAAGEALGGAAVESLAVRDGVVHLALTVPRERASALEAPRRAMEAALGRLPDVRQARVVLTAHRAPGAPGGPGAASAAGAAGTASPARPAAPAPQPLPGIAHVVAVASGKGGVGKSTVAVNLAVSLAQQGLQVGLMDADIYGPSLPRLVGEQRRPGLRENRLVPIEAWGIRTMSMGYLVDEETAMIWRGPMIMGAVQQFLGQVDWGRLDVLVVDLPPGTGDIQLTLAQRVKVTGAVVVSTPQDLALLDARRAVWMFEKVAIPVLGLVENMSYFCCPNCGHRSEIFGHGGARAEAAKLGQAFLGEIPLLAEVRALSDAGTPVVAAAPESEAGRAFAAIARQVAAHLASLPPG
ncbi:Mrp/NBP35 family ATP-binding protein [Acidisoma sp. C75]